jgi:small-conductance mechanosensitive channel
MGGGDVAYWAATAIAIVISTLLVFAIWKGLDRWRKAIHRWIDAKDRGLSAVSIQDQEIFTAREISRSLHKVVNWCWVLVRLLLVLFWLNMVFAQFHWSRDLALTVFHFIADMVQQILQNIVEYLPNLVIIILIVLLSRLITRMVHTFFEGVRLERISLPGFYPDWAQTSFGLSKVLIIAMTVVLIFPYLPGSSSPAFQGLSIFFGVLVSLGSTSVVANIMAGIVITYTRAFKIGDRVRIADTEGDVIERSAFVTRVRTPKNEEVAIPNSMVMNDHIVNFSAQAKEAGVLLHTTVTIGYDVPWPQVHELLTGAAIKTEQVLNDPSPFVLQTSLDDNYVAYELNAYTRRPSGKQKIASDMHAHIQDAFRDAGIEILSPHYRANRDGSDLTLPAVQDGSHLVADAEQEQDDKAHQDDRGESHEEPGSGRS